MGILDRLLKTEHRIRKRIENAFSDGTAKTPLEIRREILEQVEARIMPDRGGKIFPFGRIVVRLRPQDQAMRDIFHAAFVDDRSLEDKARELLLDSGVRGSRIACRGEEWGMPFPARNRQKRTPKLKRDWHRENSWPSTH